MKLRNPDQASARIVGIAERYRESDVASHTHARAQIMYAVSGAMKVFTEMGSWVLPPNRALWVPPGLAHGQRMRGTVELRTLYVAPGMRGMPKWTTCAVLDVPPLLRELIVALVSADWHYGRDTAEARLGRVLLDRLLTVAQQSVYLPEPRDVRARRFSAHMHAHVNDRRPLAAIAREAGLSARTIERLFRLETGMSVGAWTQQLRLVLALEKLAAGQSVGDAAFEVGYSNPSSFIAVFRTAFGVTPSRYFADAD